MSKKVSVGNTGPNKMTHCSIQLQQQQCRFLLSSTETEQRYRLGDRLLRPQRPPPPHLSLLPHVAPPLTRPWSPGHPLGTSSLRQLPDCDKRDFHVDTGRYTLTIDQGSCTISSTNTSSSTSFGGYKRETTMTVVGFQSKFFVSAHYHG